MENNLITKEENNIPEKKKKKFFKSKKKLLIFGGIAVLVILLGIKLFSGQSKNKNAREFVNETKAAKQTLVKTVVGTGNLVHGDTTDIKIPDGIEIEKILVSSGEYVEKGQCLAQADINTVKVKLHDVKSQLDGVDARLNRAKTSGNTNVVKSNYSGRVKKVYGEKGKNSTDVILENGGLVLLSIDGKMAVDFPSDTALSKGSNIQVKLSDGTTKTATVLNNFGKNYTATLTDDGPEVDDEVTLLQKGKEIGKGKLYISSPVTVSGPGGTINKVHIKKGDKVSVGTMLFTLASADESAEYYRLKKDREVLLEQYNTLTVMSAKGELLSPVSGTIATVNAKEKSEEETPKSSQPISSGSMQSAQGMQGMTGGNASAISEEQMQQQPSTGATTGFSIATDKQMKMKITVNEMDILSIAKDMDVKVTVDAIPKKEFAGKISRISAGTNNGNANYEADITLDRDDSMRAGMNGTAKIVTDKKEGVLVVPASAIQEVDGRVFVYTQNDKGALKGEKDVTTGLSDGYMVEIVNGLNEGDSVFYKSNLSKPMEMMMGGSQE